MHRTSVLVAILLCLSANLASSQGAEILYTQACDEGDMAACNALGLMYEVGEAVPKDLERAVGLYRMACEGDELSACTNLGFMYQLGLGVDQDQAQADAFYELACEGGDEVACISLGVLDLEDQAPIVREMTKAGRIGDAETGLALDEAIIQIPDLGIRVMSDQAGRFTLSGFIPEGRFTIKAERAGYEAAEGLVEIPGQPEFVILLSRLDVEDPSAPGSVTGRVTEFETDHGLADVDVEVLGKDGVRVLSNPRGRFHFDGLEPGPTEIRFTRLGYAPRTATLIVHPERTVDLDVSLSTRPIEIDPISVVVRSLYLEQNGFYERADRSLGSYFTEDAIEEIDPQRVSDIFRRIPGLGVEFDMLAPDIVYAFNTRGTSFVSGPCTLPVFIDDVRQFDYNLNAIPAEWIIGMEIYVGAETPNIYSSDSCGAVVIWTGRGR